MAKIKKVKLTGRYMKAIKLNTGSSDIYGMSEERAKKLVDEGNAEYVSDDIELDAYSAAKSKK